MNSSGSTSSAVERISSDMVNVSALNPCSIMLWEEWSRRLRLRIIRAHHHDTIICCCCCCYDCHPCCCQKALHRD